MHSKLVFGNFKQNESQKVVHVCERYLDRNREARKMSCEEFGMPCDPLRLQLHDGLALFKYMEIQPDNESLNWACIRYPFIKNMVERSFCKMPKLPVTVDLNAADAYLKLSRLYRLEFGMMERGTKKNMSNPSSDCTQTKFDLGINTTGSIHIGSGSVFSSSVPNAGFRYDILLGTDIFKQTLPEDLMIVSDVAVPTLDGMGCGFVLGLNQSIKKWYREGRPMLVKIHLQQLGLLEVPYAILYKPRRHNMEVIIAVNIPSVGLDIEFLTADIIRSNVARNGQCYDYSIPIYLGGIYIDTDLLEDDERTFDDELEKHDRRPSYNDYVSPVIPFIECVMQTKYPNDPHKLKQLIENGYFTYEETIDSRMIRIAKRVMDDHNTRDISSIPPEVWIDNFPRKNVYMISTFVCILNMMQLGFIGARSVNKKNICEHLFRDRPEPSLFGRI